jgi:hypothetical protein
LTALPEPPAQRLTAMDHLLTIAEDIDIDLELVPAGEPGFSRRPDLIVVDRSTVERVVELDRLV